MFARKFDIHTPPCKRGFTLAEVLITLVIIGVIAAITVPTLMNKTNNQEYVSKLKKEYSTFAQVTNKIIAEEGIPRADKGGWAKSEDAIFELYRKHLINAKECAGESGCLNQGGHRYLSDPNQVDISWFTSTTNRKLILADGSQVIFNNVSADCSKERFGSKGFCFAIGVDVNGEKKPNTWGRDAFIFVIKPNGFYPAGCDEEPSLCDKNNSGSACSCKVLREGAMNY